MLASLLSNKLALWTIPERGRKGIQTLLGPALADARLASLCRPQSPHKPLARGASMLSASLAAIVYLRGLPPFIADTGCLQLSGTRAVFTVTALWAFGVLFHAALREQQVRKSPTLLLQKPKASASQSLSQTPVLPRSPRGAGI